MPDLLIPAAPEIPGATHLHSGKVRDLYRLDEGEHAGRLLMVASDRISAFDYVLESAAGEGIPGRGRRCLPGCRAVVWFRQLDGLVENDRLDRMFLEQVRGRARCSARRWRCSRSSAWRVATWPAPGSSTTRRRVCGSAPPADLEDGSRLPEPIFTPATKAELRARRERRLRRVARGGAAETADTLERLTLAVFARAEALTRERGISSWPTRSWSSADVDRTIVLADEVC
ncbi:MAG: phosphoribosylaminoimidazolesuccinocarboxamide synthase [Nocardioides sp.]